ncbi:DNA mismatch repair protein MutL [Coprinopsis marcescibilis]|uniref:DNA mismatch repair protein PMS1 n=1 Tax=Coprinopsis marcescibilis TaxID=230819 RepID=A0A5C3KPS3_COPMA|nr:DNA mismatch repair protein MutL [Coprinopsis marcescibilis]
MSGSGGIKAIDKTSVHRITSGQVVIDLQTAVKELVENSIDAGSTNIEVRFKQHGLTSIEVIDNGCGIAEADFEGIALKHHTSKLETYEDLTSVETFGFRGEALSSLCALCGDVSVTTATTETAPKGTCLELSPDGEVKSQKVVARQRGTTVLVSKLFTPLPVRRKEFERNVKREFGKALTFLQVYALGPCSTNEGVRLSVSNQPEKGQRSIQLQTKGNPSVKDAVSSLWGPKAIENLVDLNVSFEIAPEKSVLKRLKSLNQKPPDSLRVTVKGLVSKFAVGCGRLNTDRQFFYLNGRPCNMNKIQKAFNEVYRTFNANQLPFIVADFSLPLDSCDVNVSPDKRTILIHNEDNLIVGLKEALETHFSPTRSTFDAGNLTQSLLPNTLQPTQSRTSASQRPSRSPINVDVDEETSEHGDNPHGGPLSPPRSSQLTGGSKPKSPRVPDEDEDGDAPPREPSSEPRTIHASARQAAAPIPSSVRPTQSNRTVASTDEGSQGRRDASSEASTSLPPSPAMTMSQSRPSASGDITMDTRGASWSARLGRKASPERGGADVELDHPRKRRRLVPQSEGDDDELLGPNVDDADPGESENQKDVGDGDLEDSDDVVEIAKPGGDVGKPRNVVALSGRASNNGRRSASGGRASSQVVVTKATNGKNGKRDVWRQLAGFAAAGSQVPQREESEDEADEEEEEEEVEQQRKSSSHAASSPEPLFLDEPRSPSPEAMEVDEIEEVPTLVDDGLASDAEDDTALESSPSSNTYLLDSVKKTLSEPLKLSSQTEKRPEIIRQLDSSGDVSLKCDIDRIGRVWQRGRDLGDNCSSETHPADGGSLGAGGEGIGSGTVPCDPGEKDKQVGATQVPTDASIANSDGTNQKSASKALSRVISKQDFETMDIIGQFNLGFIIVRRRQPALPASGDDKRSHAMDDLFIVDQHAADEKYNFETLQANTKIQGQRLLRPRTLELTAADEMVASEHLEVLRDNGFEVEQFGGDECDEVASQGGRLRLLSQPVSKSTVFDMKDLEELIHLLRDIPAGRTKGMVRCSKARAMFAMRACRKSVMVGMPLNRKQMATVRIPTLDNGSWCLIPYIHLSLSVFFFCFLLSWVSYSAAKPTLAFVGCAFCFQPIAAV